MSFARSILSANLGSSCVADLSNHSYFAARSLANFVLAPSTAKAYLLLEINKNGNGPPSLSAKLPAFISDRCSYSLRSSHSSQVPFCSSSAHLSSFLPSTRILWNSLHSSVACAHFLSSFVNWIDTFDSDMFPDGLS